MNSHVWDVIIATLAGLLVGGTVGYMLRGMGAGKDERHSYHVGHTKGFIDGKSEGFAEGLREGDDSGYTRGYSEAEIAVRGVALHEGDAAGYRRGWEEAIAQAKLVATEQQKPVAPVAVKKAAKKKA